MLEDIQKRLQAKTIHDLRQVARAVGVHRPADGKKERVIENVMQIAEGKADPAAPSLRGAPPKSAEYDRRLVADILRCREICLSENPGTAAPQKLTVSSDGEDLLDFKSGGVLEKSDGKWFARGQTADIFVNEQIIARNALREGDLVTGRCKRATPEQTAGLVGLESINGYPAGALPARSEFASLPARYPDRRFKTDTVCDLLSPLGAGQRAIITGAHGSGKTSVLKSLLKGVNTNCPDVKIIILLVDARPEEAEDFRSSFPRADLFSSEMDAGASAHVRTATLALEYAKRQTELSKDVLLAADGLTNLARASAIDGAKKLLAAAKNAGDCSLTVLATLDSDGGRYGDEVYSALGGLCNMRVTLSRQLALARVYPPIDKSETYASGDERLLTEEELILASELRKNNG